MLIVSGLYNNMCCMDLNGRPYIVGPIILSVMWNGSRAYNITCIGCVD